MFHTLKTNWRDILAFLLISIIACVALDYLAQWSSYRDAQGKTIPGLAMFISFLTGFGRFAAANLCAWLLGVAVGWPTLNKWGNSQDSFLGAWNLMPSHARMFVYVAVAGFELIAAALIFAPSR